MEHRFHLQSGPGKPKYTCTNCGGRKCFTRYIDSEGKITFPEYVGRCDHENSCGYHYSVSDYFRDAPEEKKRMLENGWRVAPEHRPAPRPTSYIDDGIVRRSLSFYGINSLFCYFTAEFGEEEADRLFSMYRVGTSKKWGGSAVFWQTDINGRVRSGKIMAYNPKTGHRIKDPVSCVAWSHSELHIKNFNLHQCIFGEHLLSEYRDCSVMIVESEKTAMIMAHYLPEYLWLATGGKNGCFNANALKVLSGRDVTLVPDLGATEAWREKSSMLDGICKSVVVSNALEKIASEEDHAAGLDIADFYMRRPTKRRMLEDMIKANPCVQDLITDLGLELIEE